MCVCVCVYTFYADWLESRERYVVCMNVCICVNEGMCVCVCVRILCRLVGVKKPLMGRHDVCIYMYSYMCVCIYTHICVCIYISTHI